MLHKSVMKFFKAIVLLIFLFASPGIVQKTHAATCECNDQCCFCGEENNSGLILCSCDEEGDDGDEIDLVLVNENTSSFAVHIERHLHLVRVSRLCSLLRYSEEYGSKKSTAKRPPFIFRPVNVSRCAEHFSRSLSAAQDPRVMNGSVPLTCQQRSLRL